ncbi:MAG: biotin--[acetyl-CoA-carboxylase] ligase, partial [Alphaproteobacteria bacterium]|nr:biotin--[acetyl-CoA-carboxylase] ligase [Alphaproteobacteria bacterium]
ALLAGVALWDALHAIAPAIPFQLKWPNDVLVGGAKIAGILLEREGDAVVIGIGVNLAHYPDGLERPVTSLSALDVTSPSPATVISNLAQSITARLAHWRTAPLTELLTEWQSRAHPIGTPLTANGLSGTFAGLDEIGTHKLALADGTISVIHAGDVFLV